MTILVIISLTIATIVAKPSGVIHSHPLVYSSPVQGTILSGGPAAVHHQIYQGAIAAQPHAIVHHGAVVSDVPHSVAHQHSSIVHHHNSIIADVPTVVHKSIQPAIHAYVAESPGTYVHGSPAVIHHAAIVKSAPALVHHVEPAIVEHDAVISVPNAAAVEDPKPDLAILQKSTVEHLPVIPQPTAWSGVISPAIHRHLLPVHTPAVLQKTIAAESVGVKHTLSSQSSSIIHPSPIVYQETPAIYNTVVSPAAASSARYTFGYVPSLTSEIKAVDSITNVDDKSVNSDSVVETAEVPVEDQKASAEGEIKKSTTLVSDASAEKVGYQEVVAVSTASGLPSAYSYAYIAQQPLLKAAYIHPQPIIEKVSAVVPGITLTAAGVPFETPEVIQAKAAHFAALRGLQVKDEKPCD
ncbi:hypothetical protein RI129_005236 [Pyrocoelia pectoralis]|uniref:Cuticle protein n=1 Tax=Pyrocoelia pectoralis TaxID=417401 RepID=A0AAN7ZK68_9COLE